MSGAKRIPHATVSAAATVIEKFLDANHPCQCGPDDYCPGNSDEAYMLAQDVLAAVAALEQAATRKRHRIQ